jgi:hypothetical protein
MSFRALPRILEDRLKRTSGPGYLFLVNICNSVTNKSNAKPGGLWLLWARGRLYLDFPVGLLCSPEMDHGTGSGIGRILPK